MRGFVWVAIAVGLTVSGSGCLSMMIADSGRHFDKYRDRKQVRSALGQPQQVGWKDTQEFEDFRFRGKVANIGSAQAVGTLGAMTLGLSEFYFVPQMLYALPGQLWETHNVRFYYDGNGRVARYEELKPAETESGFRPASR